MAFPSTAILDNFNRANVGPPPSASWSQGYGGALGQFEVLSNQCIVDALGLGYAENYWNVAGYNNPEEYITVVTVPATGNMVSLTIVTAATIAGGTPDGYAIVMTKAAGTDTIIIQRVDAGVGSAALATYNQEVSNGDAIGLRLLSGVVYTYYKASGGSWTELGNVADATYSGSMYLRIVTNDATTVLDDFGGGIVKLIGKVMSVNQAVNRSAVW